MLHLPSPPISTPEGNRRRHVAAPASRRGVGYGQAGAVIIQRLADDSAMSAFAAIR